MLVKYQKLKAATLATERAANAAVDPEMKVQAEAIAREQGMALRAIAFIFFFLEMKMLWCSMTFQRAGKRIFLPALPLLMEVSVVMKT